MKRCSEKKINTFFAVFLLSCFAAIIFGMPPLLYSSPWRGPGGFTPEFSIPEFSFLPSKLSIDTVERINEMLKEVGEEKVKMQKIFAGELNFKAVMPG